ncbi:nineteen complex-related protein 2-domain-containing protein [Ampelomyces quisqualis]|uniref:Nineteen complex-related protein 2-domain-containing protein n=1 Tax=Ampelomyces quisqualis TaxID=50730 RepID=A0A6A5QBP6_AMPQU|nr:nineteen complex-related protein 2-domain-containing protein [Ampelomyces quisqualis]
MHRPTTHAMKRSGSGRIARKVGAYDDSADSAESSSTEVQKPTVKRPTFGKGKKRSSLRISFGPSESDANDGDESSDAAPVVTPKKTNLSRIALEKSAQLRARSPLVPEAERPADEERPSYSKDYIAELRNSTPSTPRDLKPSAEEEEETQALDIASKFGSAIPLPTEASSAIPTQAEISEKKARRRRLAQEENAYDEDEDRPWASDDEGEDEFRQRKNEISLRPKDKYPETRLIHDDEDIAEGFDDFVEDGKISLSRKSEREAQRKRRAEMAELINDAEGSEDDGSGDSDEERNAAFATAQARAGRYGQKIEDEDDGSKTPPRITPLPQLDEILEGLTLEIQTKKQRKQLILQKLQEFKEDKVRIEQRKKYLQEQLQKTGDEYEKLRQESGLPALPSSEVNGGRLITERGLDSLGTTPLADRSGANSEDE